MASTTRKILFITERRADYSHLKPIMKEVQKSRKLKLQLVVTGAHLLKYLGETQRVVRADGFKIDAQLPIFTSHDKDDGTSMALALGRAVIGMTKILEKLKPNLLFVGFDIGAHLAAAIAAMHLNIHVSHLHGGDVSGTIDEVIRHALTKFSHIHFAATKQSRQRIIKMGENPNYVFNVGSPSIQTIKTVKYLSKKQICQKFGLNPSKKLIIFVQHPVTTEINEVIKQITQSIEAIREIVKRYQVECIATYSNNDAGGKRIIKKLEASGIKVVPTLIHEDFLNLMNQASVLVGNSSAGIIESSSFGLPTVNIGTRQQFRERGQNVIDVKHKKTEIVKAIESCLLNRRFIRHCQLSRNPYDNGNTAKKVVKILENLKFPPIQKVITY